MPRYYIHRTFAALVTEVLEIEAEDEIDALDSSSGGEYIGLAVGDSIEWAHSGNEEIFKAEPYNLPPGFQPCQDERKGGSDAPL